MVPRVLWLACLAYEGSYRLPGFAGERDHLHFLACETAEEARELQTIAWETERDRESEEPPDIESPVPLVDLGCWEICDQ